MASSCWVSVWATGRDVTGRGWLGSRQNRAYLQPRPALASSVREGDRGARQGPRAAGARRAPRTGGRPGKGGAGCSLPRVPDWQAREPAACRPGVQCSGEGSGGQRPRSCLRKDRLRLQRPQPGPRRPLSVESFRARRPAAGGRRLVTLTPGAAPNWGPRVPCAPPSPGVTGGGRHVSG